MSPVVPALVLMEEAKQVEAGRAVPCVDEDAIEHLQCECACLRACVRVCGRAAASVWRVCERVCWRQRAPAVAGRC